MTVEQKQVNIALETVMNFGGKRDKSSGLEVIDKVQNALEKIKQGIESRNGRRSGRDHGITFSDFVSKAAQILKNYSDNDLEDVFAVIGDETKRHINRNGELHELFGSGNMRRRLSKQLEDFREMPADVLREHLTTAIVAVQNKKYNGEKNDLLDIGDFVYIGGHDKLRSVLRDLEKLGRSTDVRLDDVLRHVLRSLIFDHFNKLKDNIKRELIDMAKDYWKVSSSKVWNRKTRPTTFTVTPLEEDEYTSNNDRHVYRNRLSMNAQKRQQTSDVRPNQRTKKTYNASRSSRSSRHVNKRYKYENRIKTDRQAVTAFTKLHKYKEHTRLMSTLSDEITNPPFQPESDNKTTAENNEGKIMSSKPSRKYIKKNQFTPSVAQTKIAKHSKHGDKPIDSPYSDLKLLKGGQNVQDVDLRGHSTEETYDNYGEPDKTKEQQLSKHSVVVSHRPTAKYLSVERFITIKKKNIPKVKEEKDKKKFKITVANISAEGTDYDLEIYDKLENDRKLANNSNPTNDHNLTNDRELDNDRKITNNRELTNDHELKNDRKLEGKVIRKYIKNDRLQIESFEAENDREFENSRNLKIENKIIRKYIENETLEIQNSEAENDSELEIDRENKVIKKYIKNDTSNIEKSEVENDSGLKNGSKLTKDTLKIDDLEVVGHRTTQLENKVIKEYIKNATSDDVKNIFKNVEKQIADVREQVREGFGNDRELENKVIRTNSKNDILRIDNLEASIHLKNMINNIQNQIEDARDRFEKGIENNCEFEKDRKLENKDSRKYIINDTLKINNSGAPIDVKHMITNIEKLIDDVREQVDYVKNLSNIDDNSSKQIFRANSKKVSLRSSKNKTKTKHKHHYPDSESLERDNKAYFSRASSESGSSIEVTKESSLAFRADEATNYTRNDTATKINDIKTPKSVIVDKTSATNDDRVIKINFLLRKIKENVTVKNSFEEADKSISDEASKIEFNKTKTQGLKVNDGDTKPFTVNMTINEIDTTTENTFYQI